MKQFAVIFAIFLASAVTANGAVLPKDENCVCTKIFKPVCGSNGVTYANQCGFECAAARTDEILTMTNGPCMPKPRSLDCICTRIFSPVCGSNGVTYSNMCMFECEAARSNEILTATRGVCMPKPKARQACLCTKIYKPVCGSDGETYANMCEFECVAAQATDVVLTARNGACAPKPMARQACLCTKIYKPVCGSDGETYANMCEFECVAAQATDVILTARNGACAPKPMARQACLCTKIYKPVCGSDGETYANMCEFECVAAQATDVVLTARNGACAPKPMARQACLCTKIYKPVCGSDGETYANMCEFECVAAQATDVVLTAKNGACAPQPMARQACICTEVYQPVCGSNGVTYGNKCQFECVASKTTDVVLTARNGACSPKPMARQACLCTKIFKPVCGSDGETYANMCEFECVAAQATDVVLTAKNGACAPKPIALQACRCTKIYKPVCGSNGVTYGNKCTFECAAAQTTDVVLTARNGACAPKPMARQACICTENYQPVCGSNGVTYGNMCQFDCVAAQTTDVVLTARNGACLPKPMARQACLCTKIYKPVCGSDGETYANMCEFECVAAQSTDKVLTATTGAC